MLGEIALTFIPALSYLAAGVAFVAAFLWWQRRRADPEYAPAWTIVYIYAVAAAILAGMGAEYLLRKAAPARGRHSSRAALGMTMSVRRWMP
jgi:hypothetical protein